MTITAKRSGLTALTWSTDPSRVGLSAPGPFEDHPGHIRLDFSMPSKGGGITQVRLEITGESFERLAIAMIKVDREAALRAFGSALLQQPAPVEIYPF
ncbi:hypothetical protein ABIE41_002144 [Bosea sp. OAE506]|uniref:hypothetical protein n=1 Tax=Bosea sp. OAE506 TaxID=2663870 RepID=UPI001789E4FE